MTEELKTRFRNKIKNLIELKEVLNTYKSCEYFSSKEIDMINRMISNISNRIYKIEDEYYRLGGNK